MFYISYIVKYITMLFIDYGDEMYVIIQENFF